MLHEAAHLAETAERNAGYIRAAPCGDLAVAMLADNKSMYGAAVDAKVLSQKVLEPCGIEHCPGTENAVIRIPAEDLRRVCQNVDRIRDDQHDRILIIFRDLGNHLPEDADILLYKIKSCLSGLLAGACRHNDDARVADVFVAAGVNLHRLGKRKSVADIKGLPFCLVFVGINQYQLGKESALHQGERRSRSDETTSYDCCFSAVQTICHCCRLRFSLTLSSYIVGFIHESDCNLCYAETSFRIF